MGAFPGQNLSQALMKALGNQLFRQGNLQSEVPGYLQLSTSTNQEFEVGQSLFLARSSRKESRRLKPQAHQLLRGDGRNDVERSGLDLDLQPLC